MTMTAHPATGATQNLITTPGEGSSPARRGRGWAGDLLRIGLGLVFLWAFVDKLIGLSYSTPGARSWLGGGSPTNGFLGHVEVGPLQSVFRGMAGQGWADWLFMLALLGIGAALVLGVAQRITAVAGTVLMVLMWAAEWPPARFDSLGEATGSTNPLLDYHLIYALGLWAVVGVGSASMVGLGARWARLPFVQRHQWAR